MLAEPLWISEAALENTILTGLSGDQKGFRVQVGSRTQKDPSSRSRLWGQTSLTPRPRDPADQIILQRSQVGKNAV